MRDPDTLPDTPDEPAEECWQHRVPLDRHGCEGCRAREDDLDAQERDA